MSVLHLLFCTTTILGLLKVEVVLLVMVLVMVSTIVR